MLTEPIKQKIEDLFNSTPDYVGVGWGNKISNDQHTGENAIVFNVIKKRPLSEIPEEEQKNHPIPGKEGEFMKFRTDMTTLERFPERYYVQALDYIGALAKQLGLFKLITYLKIKNKMKNFLNKNWVRFTIIGLFIIANVLFYALGAPESGAMAAVVGNEPAGRNASSC